MGLVDIFEKVKPSLDDIGKASKKLMKVGVLLLSFSVFLFILLLVAILSELIGQDESSIFIGWIFSQTGGIFATFIFIVPATFVFKEGVKFFTTIENEVAKAVSDFILGPAMFFLGFLSLFGSTLLAGEAYSSAFNELDGLVFGVFITLLISTATSFGLGAMLYGLCAFVSGFSLIADTVREYVRGFKNMLKNFFRWEFHSVIYRYAVRNNMTLFQVYWRIYYRNDLNRSDLKFTEV